MAQGVGGGTYPAKIDSIADAEGLETLGGDGDATDRRSPEARFWDPVKAKGPLAQPNEVTRSMRLGLDLAGLLAVYGTIVQLLVVVWLGVAVFIAVSAGTVLLRSGTFERTIFATCSLHALAVDAVLLAGLIGAWLAKPRTHRPHPTPGIYVRHPVTTTAIGLLAMLGAVTAFGWSRSSEAVQQWTTTVILANAYFFALLAVAWTLRAIVLLWLALKRWALASAYRIGALTILLGLVGATGILLRYERWYAVPAREVGQEVNLAPVLSARGIVDVQLAALCVATEEVAERSDAPEPLECRPVLHRENTGDRPADLGAGSLSNDCFTTLHPKLPGTRDFLRRTMHLAPYDADDTVMQALLVTCTKEPPPVDPMAYLYSVAHNYALRQAERGRRYVPYDELTVELPATCDPKDSPEQREARLARLWDTVLGEAGDITAKVVHDRLVDDLSYREIGQRRNLHETVAKDTFNNAIKKLRRDKRRFADCFP